MSQPHKHADLIIAWANGGEIEVKDMYGNWIQSLQPSWSGNMEYRIKPKRIKKEGWVNVYNNEHVCMYPTKENADVCARPDRLACIRIEWEEEQ